MKTRDGFISNSSSTSFTFAHKGTSIDELYAMIQKWHQYFDLTWENDWEDDIKTRAHIQAQDVIAAIKNIDPKQWEQPETMTIDEYIAYRQHHVDQYMQWAKEAAEKANKDKDSYLHHRASEAFQDVYEAEHFLREAQSLKERGFQMIHIVGFGDNHGSISGPGIGSIMDYEGRSIRIDKEDFFVRTEQNR